MSARYFCIDCWQTVGGVERARPPAALEAAPSAAPPEVEAAPVEEILPAPPAPRAAPPVGLHWIEDPNRQNPLVVRAAPAPARPLAATTAPSPLKAAAAPSLADAAAPAAGMRRKWETLVETLLGEDEQDEAAGPPRGPVFCSCGAPLDPAALLEGKPALLGFAGGGEAGRTLLLAAMLHQLELAEPPAGLPRIALQGLGDSDEVFRGLRRDLFRHGRKPPSIAGKSFGWRLRLARSGADRRPQPLRGGVSQLVGVPGGAGDELGPRHDELLSQILFLIDGAALAADLQLGTGDAWSASASPGDLGGGDLRRFSALCARLGPRARDVSLAIVVTKADLLAGSADWAELGPGGAPAAAERQEKIASLLQETWRGSIWEEARDRFRRAGLFACSSLGFRPTEAELDPEGRLNRRPQPYRVLEPLHFLLEDVLPRRRA